MPCMTTVRGLSNSLPRSIERGPVEAEGARTCGPGWWTFRAQLSAAPLKQNEPFDLRYLIHAFRAQLSAAPLKHRRRPRRHKPLVAFRAQLSAAPLKLVGG